MAKEQEWPKPHPNQEQQQTQNEAEQEAKRKAAVDELLARRARERGGGRER
jgi:DNA-binding TFAR19-related protein (PDSD5 family)